MNDVNCDVYKYIYKKWSAADWTHCGNPLPYRKSNLFFYILSFLYIFFFSFCIFCLFNFLLSYYFFNV